MQINSQFPVVSQPTHGRTQNAGYSGNPSQQLVSAKPVPSSVADFDGVMGAESSARFSPYGDFNASTQQALNAYQATESLSSANPRNVLIGIDVFA